jgi:hypothetical protein
MPEMETGIALILLLWIANVEQPTKINRKWILDTLVQCLAAVRMEKVVVELY